MTKTKSEQPECCPKFNPEPWDEKSHEWHEKKFIKDKVFTIFHMPVNFGSVITRMMKKVDQAGATSPDNLCLSDHTSLWSMDIYVAVDKHIPEAENTTMSGKFMSRVYEGPFSETANWIKDFMHFLKGKKLRLQKTLMWYTTCPKCARKYGKNYVVIVGKLK